MNVTKENIDTAHAEFSRLIPTASFVSVDLEMTGIHLPDCKESLTDTPSARYRKMRTIVNRYTIVQVGLTMFHRSSTTTTTTTTGMEYEARTYNTFVFPPAGYEITLEGGAVRFLVGNGMDWNVWFRDGVPYLPRDAAERLRVEMFPPSEEAETTNGDETVGAAVLPASAAKKKKRKDRNGGGMMRLTKAEDIKFCEEVLEKVKEWVATLKDTNDDSLPQEHILPPCNSYLRRYLYQELERLYCPSVSTTTDSTATSSSAATTPSSSSSSTFSIESRTPDPTRPYSKLLILVYYSTLTQRQTAETKALQAKTKAYHDQLGFRRIWTALTESQRPLVVHNGWFDLLFLVRHFEGTLPETLGGFRTVVGELFPGGVWDTRWVGGTVLVVEENEDEEGKDVEGGSCGVSGDVSGGGGNDGNGDEKRTTTVTTSGHDEGNTQPQTQTQTQLKRVSLFPDLRLDRLYNVCHTSATKSSTPHLPRMTVKFANGHDRYRTTAGATLHEAGYDSYITAFSFAYMREVLAHQKTRHGRCSPLGSTTCPNGKTEETKKKKDGVVVDDDLQQEPMKQYVNHLPLSRSFYNELNLSPDATDALSPLVNEQRYVIRGFPSEYTTSDILCVCTTPPAFTDVGEGTTVTESTTTNTTVVDPAAAAPLPPIDVSVRWIDDRSVVLRFGNEVADRVLAHVRAHAKIRFEGRMRVVPLEEYLCQGEEKAEEGECPSGISKTSSSTTTITKTTTTTTSDGVEKEVTNRRPREEVENETETVLGVEKKAKTA